MRKYQSGFTVIELIFVAGGFAVLALIIAALYVAGHFISKFW